LRIATNIDHALHEIDQWNPYAGRALRMLVHTVVAIEVDKTRAGGSSHSDAIGVVCMRTDSNWSVSDCAECLLHEAVHQALFMEDAVVGIFTEMAFVDPPMLPSAVRTIYPSNQEPFREFWAALHAFCVGCWLKTWFEDRRPSRAMAFEHALSDSQKYLRLYPQLLTARGRALVGA
jgi:hypothetical protein